MTRVILVSVLLLVVLTGCASAVEYCWDNGDEEGVYTFQTSVGNTKLTYFGCGEDLWIDWYGIDSGSSCAYVTKRTSSATCIGTWFGVGSTYYSEASGTVDINVPAWQMGWQMRATQAGDPYNRFPLFVFLVRNGSSYNVSGATACIDLVELYVYDGSAYTLLDSETVTVTGAYSFKVADNFSYRLLFDGAYHDFTVDGGDIIFDYGECLWVYGYTCGIDTIKLYKDDGGWVLDDTKSSGAGYAEYDIPILSGEDYLISFVDSGTVCYNKTFSSSGDHVLVDFDRCTWVWPPSPWATPYRIYLPTGYDYNIVIFKDEHGNFIENSQLAIYDKTDGTYIQRWTDTCDGYALLGAKFPADHDVLLSLRTFDGVFTLETTCPANGSAVVGEEDITTLNWTVPIRYNLDILPVATSGTPLFDVFCGLSEYTPLDAGSFWGMDLSDRGYVPVSSCSGFSMCDITAEKDGYADYNVEALNWTSRSAMVKDYRHNIVMEEE